MKQMHLIKYALWKLYELGIHFSSENEQFLDIARYFITFVHDKITHINNFKNINLSSQHMRNIQLGNSYMSDIDLTNTNIILEKNPRHFFDYPPHRWNFCIVYMHKINFANANISNVTFFNVVLKQVDFTNSNLSFAYFIECKFNKVIFNDADLSGSMFDECEFKNIEFRNTNLRCGKFIYCNFQKTNFVDCNLSNSLLHNAGSWDDSSFVNCMNDDIIIDDMTKILIKDIDGDKFF